MSDSELARLSGTSIVVPVLAYLRTGTYGTAVRYRRYRTTVLRYVGAALRPKFKTPPRV